MLREVKTPDACFCLRMFKCRRGTARAQRGREYKKQSAQSLQGDEAQKGLEQGGHVSEFSCLLPRQLSRKRYSFGPRFLRALQIETTTISSSDLRARYTWYSLFSSSKRCTRRFAFASLTGPITPVVSIHSTSSSSSSRKTSGEEPARRRKHNTPVMFSEARARGLPAVRCARARRHHDACKPRDPKGGSHKAALCDPPSRATPAGGATAPSSAALAPRRHVVAFRVVVLGG